MSLFVLTCPNCGFSKELLASVLPPAGTSAGCPRCKDSFTLSSDCLSAVEGPSPFPPSPAPETVTVEREEPQPPLEQPRTSPPRRQTFAFTFSGTAKEYFGIWIVNTLLRIVTLGLYSPWAKVRKRRFFYGNTLLNKAPFDYLADPFAIFKGWIVAIIFFGLYSFASQVNPIAAAVLMLVGLALFPWVMVRSRIFNLRNSSHRNIRFGFNPDYKGAYGVFLWWQLLIPLTLGIITPYVLYRQKRFLVENSFYGTTPFSFHATARDYFRIFRPVFLIVLLMAASFGGLWFMEQAHLQEGPLQIFVAMGFLFGIFGMYFVVGLYLPTALANLTWSSTSIGSHRFTCTLKVRELLNIQVSNGIAVMLSLGLLTPWASVRLARYRLERLTLQGAGDLDYITAAATETTGATGEELGEVFGLDFGL